MHAARLPSDRLLSDCEVRRQRRSGPGGQHRNKVETGIFIEHRPTGIRAEATEKRSQPKNQLLAIFRLRVNLAVGYRSASGDSVVSQVSDLWKSRCRCGKISVNPEHEDFPSLLAEALDVLQELDWDAKLAAEKLGCSASQLVKFLKKEARGLTELNRQRELIGLGKLR